MKSMISMIVGVAIGLSVGYGISEQFQKKTIILSPSEIRDIVTVVEQRMTYERELNEGLTKLGVPGYVGIYAGPGTIILDSKTHEIK